jgi:hypothetical protein
LLQLPSDVVSSAQHRDIAYTVGSNDERVDAIHRLAGASGLFAIC